MTSLIADRAMLIHVNISVWRGELTDRGASAAVAESHKANPHQLRTIKSLIPKEALQPILTAADALRAYARRETLPWQWSGVGLLPSEAFMDFVRGWNDHKVIFADAVKALQCWWAWHVAAGRAALGALAHDYDYPTRDEVVSRFAASFRVYPVPDGDDFRCSVGEAEAEAIRADLRAENEAALIRCQEYLWQQMAEHVSHMQERLSAYGRGEDGKVTGRFHDTLVGNLRALCSRLGKLNLTGDEGIASMRRELLDKLCAHEPEALRFDETLRISVKDAASELLDRMARLAPAAIAASLQPAAE